MFTNVKKTFAFRYFWITSCYGLLLIASAFASPIKIYLDNHDLSSYHMSLLSRIVYEKDEQKLNIALKKLDLGICLNGIVNAKRFLKVNNKALVLTDQTNVYVVFRGTKSFTDFLADMKYYVVPKIIGNKSFYVHKGFYQVAKEYINNGILKTIKGCLNGGNVYIAGHSLGGAVANLLALEAIEYRLPLGGVYTFGAPQVGGSGWVDIFIDKIGSKSRQWINSQDPIPKLPLGSLIHEPVNITDIGVPVGKGKDFQRLPQQNLETASTLQVVLETINPIDGKDRLTYHSIKTYVYDLWDKYHSQFISKEFAPNALIYNGACSSNRECYEFEQCDTLGDNQCVPKDLCKSDTDCPSKQFCKKLGRNRCIDRRTTGKKCFKNRHCQSGNCSLFKCVAKDECQSDDDCGSQQFCKKLGRNECLPLLSKGSKCIKSRHCQSGRCFLFMCK